MQTVINNRIPLLTISGLEADFDGFKAVNGFSTVIYKGELRVILGANGAGKTTLMDLISGKTKATAGTIHIDEDEITNLPEHLIARRGIRRKFQIPSVFRDLTVRQNLEVAFCPSPLVRHNMFQRQGRLGQDQIDEILDLIDLGDVADRLAGTLSHGQKQWLELGMLLIQEPRVLLLDEPTAGMTADETQKTARIINGLKGTHTLLVVEHDMSFVRSIADIITVMHQGQFLAEGTVAQIEVDQKVKEAYLGNGSISNA